MQTHAQHLCGVVVIDVVEGTALAALQHMRRILEQRPQSFVSVQDAIKFWCVKFLLIESSV